MALDRGLEDLARQRAALAAEVDLEQARNPCAEAYQALNDECRLLDAQGRMVMMSGSKSCWTVVCVKPRRPTKEHREAYR